MSRWQCPFPFASSYEVAQPCREDLLSIFHFLRFLRHCESAEKLMFKDVGVGVTALAGFLFIYDQGRYVFKNVQKKYSHDKKKDIPGIPVSLLFWQVHDGPQLNSEWFFCCSSTERNTPSNVSGVWKKVTKDQDLVKVVCKYLGAFT